MRLSKMEQSAPSRRANSRGMTLRNGRAGPRHRNDTNTGRQGRRYHEARRRLVGAISTVTRMSAKPPGKTRAQVRAELAAARAAGQIPSGDLDYPPPAPAASHKTRAQVRAELARARAAGEMSSGDLDYPPERPPATRKTRAQVRAELEAAKAAGEVSFGDLDYPPEPR